MGSSAEDTTWTCRSCGNKFVPQPPDYSCPECHGNLTFPNGLTEKIRLEKIRSDKRERAREEQKRREVEVKKPGGTQLLYEHMIGLGIDACLVEPGDPESDHIFLPDWRGDSLVGCVKIKGRNIDLIDVLVAWDKGAQYHFYYDYRIKADVGVRDNQLRCEWRPHVGNGKKHWRGLAITPEENQLKRMLFGDKTSDNRLSDLLNSDKELTERLSTSYSVLMHRWLTHLGPDMCGSAGSEASTRT